MHYNMIYSPNICTLFLKILLKSIVTVGEKLKNHKHPKEYTWIQ